jgi:hypothetical protein
MRYFSVVCTVVYIFIACQNDNQQQLPPRENCSNGIDDDGDGFTDCDDYECAWSSFCQPAVEICNNGIDDDGDQMIDCQDYDCAGNSVCQSVDPVCGNGILEYGEQCDSWNLDDYDCWTLGYSGGTLNCTAQCTFTVSACFQCANGQCEMGENEVNCPEDCDGPSLCGNGVIDYGEECDASNLNGLTCRNMAAGYTGGILRCASYCLYDVSACYYCGNGHCESGENVFNCQVDCQYLSNCGNGVCENGESSLNCPSDCHVNTGNCGNAIIDSGESCDGANLGGQTCVSLGYDYGTLSCASNCQFNVAYCVNISTGEICNNGIDDDGNGAVDCFDDACFSDPFCRIAVCGDGFCDPGETHADCPADCP